MSERLRLLLGWVGALVLGLVLLVAVYAKAIDPVAFAEQMSLEGLGFGAPRVMALVALVLEAVLGMALVLQIRRPIVLIPTTVMVAFFMLLTGRSWYLDAHGLLPEGASCGCFGNLVDRTPKQAFWSDAALLLPTLALAWWGREPSSRRWHARLVGAVVVALLVGVFAWRAPGLPLDDLATRLALGTRVDEICVGAETRVCLPDLVHSTDLTRGEHWVMLTDLESLQAVVDPLNQRVWDGSEPPFHVFTSADGPAAKSFGFEYGPAFDLHAETPLPLIRPLYRRLPRSFRIVDGAVVETASGWPPWLAPASPGDPS
jgi:uncharacterized membrane protein YphA (DoxX/SURF4 family)